MDGADPASGARKARSACALLWQRAASLRGRGSGLAQACRARGSGLACPCSSDGAQSCTDRVARHAGQRANGG